MWGKLIILSILVCAVLAQRDAEESHHNDYTMGSSGVKCTKVGRKCVFNATCSNHRCHCPRGQRGNAEIECVNRGEDLCYLAGDPHVVGFGRARGMVPLPCRFRATRFVTDNLAAVTPHGTCSVEVFATNELFNGRYRVRTVHISVGITFPAEQSHTNIEVTKTTEYNVNASEIYDYQMKVITRDSIWGSNTNNGTEIIPHYDDVNNFAVLEVPHCQIRIKYRASDLFRPYHPPQLPGLTIMAPHHAEFIAGYGDYPNSVCGTPEDKRSLYNDRAAQLNLPDKSHAILFDILASEPAQTDNANSGHCNASIRLFKSSSDQEQDIRICGFLLTKGQLGGCIGRIGLTPIVVFNACMALQQGRNENCSDLVAAAAKCGSNLNWSSGLNPNNIVCP